MRGLHLTDGIARIYHVSTQPNATNDQEACDRPLLFALWKEPFGTLLMLPHEHGNYFILSRGICDAQESCRASLIKKGGCSHAEYYLIDGFEFPHHVWGLSNPKTLLLVKHVRAAPLWVMKGIPLI